MKRSVVFWGEVMIVGWGKIIADILTKQRKVCGLNRTFPISICSGCSVTFLPGLGKLCQFSEDRKAVIHRLQ